MKSVLLVPFLFLYTLKSFVTVGDTYPITDLNKEDYLEDNSITKSESIPINNEAVSFTPYSCVYIPVDLDFCNFIREDLWKRKLSEKEHRMLLKRNKIYLSHAMSVPEMKNSSNQKPVKTIIYEIQRCVPPRLPFNLPSCTSEDLSDKKSEIRRLYPFAIDGFSKATYEFPMFDFSKRLMTYSVV